VTSKPVTMIINTHTHNDHTGSNTEFAPGVEYVAHENTKASLSRETCAPVTNCQSFKGENAKFLPKRTFKDELTLGRGRDQIDLFYFGRGHTNGNTWVVFPAVRTMHTGDMFQRKNMPFIDYENSGGSAVEFARTQSRALAAIKNVDTIIPGHFNGIMTWDDFKEGVAYYADFLSSVQKSMMEGRSVEQAAVSWKIPGRFQNFQTDAARVKSNVEGIYAELSKNGGR
jgi:cyclase